MAMSDASLANELIRVVLCGRTNGGLCSLVDESTGRDFIAPGPRPLYRLVLARTGEEPVEVSSLDAGSVVVERSSSSDRDVVILNYGRHRGLDLRVTCCVSLAAGSAVSRWRIAICNNTKYGVRAILYPVIVCPPVLGESEEDDCYLSGIWGGAVFKKPNKPGLEPRQPTRDWFPNIQYPGLVSVQMQAYYDETAGLYLATYDDAGCVKQFGLFRDGNDFDLSIEHNFDERPGLDFELPYDTAAGIFHGDWYDAADIYKAWAHRQHWCARKLAEREDIPAWLKEPRPCMMIISQGNVERARGTLSYPPAEYPIGRVWPARKAVALVRRYSTIFGTPVTAWMEGWEKIGSPGGPAEIFPPREGEESYKAAMADFARDGTPVLMYLAGFHWCYKRPMTGYSDWERFEREGRAMAVVNAEGGLNVSTPASRPYLAGQKHFVPLCAGCGEVQDLYFRNFMKLMDLGAAAVQLDQQLGFYADACYSDGHDHTPGYGPWMYGKPLGFIRRVRSAIKERDRGAAISCEGWCEAWMQELDLALDRPYMLGTVPLFQYLYHEYAIALGGDVLMGLCHPEVSLIKHAAVFVRGVGNIVDVGEPEYDLDVNAEYPALVLLRSIFQAQRTFARDYVVFGQMQRPTRLEAGSVTVDLYRSADSLEVPKVLHSVWKSQAGKTGYALVNWTGAPEEVTVTLAGRASAASIVTAGGIERVEHSEVTSGRITTVVPPRSVAVIEQE